VIPDPGGLVAFGPLLLAIPVAMLAGLVSFLSPCCLPLVPGYLAYVTGTAGADAESQNISLSKRPDGTAPSATAVATKPARTRRPSRTVIGTLLFVLGFAAVFTSYGAAFGAAESYC
jgi:cytochrome c-type biogenesis protein